MGLIEGFVVFYIWGGFCSSIYIHSHSFTFMIIIQYAHDILNKEHEK